MIRLAVNVADRVVMSYVEMDERWGQVSIAWPFVNIQLVSTIECVRWRTA